jgi:hypothetical protein
VWRPAGSDADHRSQRSTGQPVISCTSRISRSFGWVLLRQEANGSTICSRGVGPLRMRARQLQLAVSTRHHTIFDRAVSISYSICYMHATDRLGKSKTCFLGNCSKRYGTWRTSLVGPAGGGFGFTSPGKALCGVGNGFEVLFCTMARRRSSCLLLHLGSKLCVKAASRAGAILRTLPATCPGLIYSTRRHAASSPEQALSVALSQSAARYRSRDHAQHPATPPREWSSAKGLAHTTIRLP